MTGTEQGSHCRAAHLPFCFGAIARPRPSSKAGEAGGAYPVPITPETGVRHGVAPQSRREITTGVDGGSESASFWGLTRSTLRIIYFSGRAGHWAAGLNPDAPKGLREWWETSLRRLIETFGRQTVAQRVACLQLTPWASNGFDDALRLPSRSLVLEAADRCSIRGALMLVMRSETLWLEAPALAASSKRYRAINRRRAYVTKGNLGDSA